MALYITGVVEPKGGRKPENNFTFFNTYVRNSLLTKATEQSPYWEANQFSPSQEIPRILGNPKVNYRIHKCPPPVPVLR
jgi:hypothetical protein